MFKSSISFEAEDNLLFDRALDTKSRERVFSKKQVIVLYSGASHH